MTMTINASLDDLIARHNSLSQEVVYLRGELNKARRFRAEVTYPGLQQAMVESIAEIERRIDIFTTEITSIEDELERRGVPRVTKP